MALAAIILSTISLISSLALLVVFLAKNVFSSHSIQYENPFKDMTEPGQIGNSMDDLYRDLGDPVSSDEMDALRARLKKVIK